MPIICKSVAASKLLWHSKYAPDQESMQGVEKYAVYTPTNVLFINLVKSSKFTLKYTIISLLHVSVFNDHHQGALSVPN